MAKDINIHIKTRGAKQTKGQIDEVGKSTARLGETTEKTGSQSQRGAGRVSSALGKLATTLGITFSVSALAAMSVRVARFFDGIKTKIDEAVGNLEKLRREFESVFEAASAFDEKTRAEVTADIATLLKQTAVPRELALPVINAYMRQFQELVKVGQITQQQYDQGLKDMLGYAARHGGEATADLIALMRGWGMVTPERQGEFRRMIAAGAQKVGLTDKDIIQALGRAQPAIQAMRWTPAQALETIAVLAAGEVGRKRAALPATTLDALMAPQIANIEKYLLAEAEAQGKVTTGIEDQVKARAEALGRDPRRLLFELEQRRQRMDEQAFTRMLIDVYGREAGAGVSKLLISPRGQIRRELLRATDDIEAEIAEELRSRRTLFRRKARVDAAALEDELDLTVREQYESLIRDIGEARQKWLRRREPVKQDFREFFTIGEEREKEIAAFLRWRESLSEEEKARIKPIYTSYPGPGRRYIPPSEQVWERMTPEERYEALVGGERVPPRILKQQVKIEPEVTTGGPVRGDVDAEAPTKKVTQRIELDGEITTDEPIRGDVDTEAPTKKVTQRIDLDAEVTKAEPVRADVDAEAPAKRVTQQIDLDAEITEGEPVSGDVDAEAPAKEVTQQIDLDAEITEGEPVSADVDAEAPDKEVTQRIDLDAEVTKAEPVRGDVDAEAPDKEVTQQIDLGAEITEGGPVRGDVDAEAPAKKVTQQIDLDAEITRGPPVQTDVPVKKVAQQIIREDELTRGASVTAGPAGQTVVVLKEVVVKEVPVEIGPATTVHHHYNMNRNYYPSVGNRGIGPRFTQVG